MEGVISMLGGLKSETKKEGKTDILILKSQLNTVCSCVLYLCFGQCGPIPVHKRVIVEQ